MRIKFLTLLGALLLCSNAVHAQERATVTADRANLRASASVESAIVTTLSKGTIVTVVERTGGWARVAAGDRSGWIRSSLLAGAGSAAPLSPTQGSLRPAPEPPRAVAPPSTARPATREPEPRATVPRVSPAAFKDPGTATMIAIFVTGGGHIWSGETKKGVTYLAAGTGAVLGGVILSSALAGGCDSYSCSNPFWPYLLGLGVYTTSWVLSLMDAGNSAERMNAARGYRTSALPRIMPEVSEGIGGTVNAGLRISIR